MPVTRNTPKEGGWFKKTTQSDIAQVGEVQPTNNTAQVGEIQPTNNTAQVEKFSLPTTLPRWRGSAHQQHCPGGRGSAHQQHCPGGRANPSQGRFYIRHSTQWWNDTDAFNDAKDFWWTMKFQRETWNQKKFQKCQDSQLPPLEKVPEIDWTHNDRLHSHYTIWKEQWNAIFKSNYLFASDAVKVHKLYRHIGDEGQKKIK